MAIRFFLDPVRVLSIGRNPIQGFVYQSDPFQVLSIRSVPGVVNAHIFSEPIKNCTTLIFSSFTWETGDSTTKIHFVTYSFDIEFYIYTTHSCSD